MIHKLSIAVLSLALLFFVVTPASFGVYGIMNPPSLPAASWAQAINHTLFIDGLGSAAVVKVEKLGQRGDSHIFVSPF